MIFSFHFAKWQLFRFISFAIWTTLTLQQTKIVSRSVEFASVADSGNYTCDELTRWLGTEKHYSNDKKEVLFGLLVGKDCFANKAPVIFLDDMSFGYQSSSDARTFFQNTPSKLVQRPCSIRDEYAVAFLSNFSINNNFSHFLHSLLRLFCALLDARWLVWDPESSSFIQKVKYSIWLDEYFKISDSKLIWLGALGGTVRSMGKSLAKGSCVSTSVLLYGSGCVKLLPPEKWFGYPHCRASEVLPAFGHHMRNFFGADGLNELIMIDDRSIAADRSHVDKARKLLVAFAVREASDLTGKRSISNLRDVQKLLKKTQHIKTTVENVTFEHFDVNSTIRYMAGVHIFVSVHGAGMTNMFFMNPGSAVVEIIPYPLCNCQSPDYFYGVGGYYHGNAIAQNIKHYPYCVPPDDTIWHIRPKNLHDGMKCSWKHLHAVESVKLDSSRFVSLMRNVERDLVSIGTIVLTAPIIGMNPHANG